MEIIENFVGEYEFLDNTYYAPLKYKGVMYSNAESAYQAERTQGSGLQGMFIPLSGSEARTMGMFMTERPGWDSMKFHVLYDITKSKFEQNPALYARLAETKNAQISNAFLGEILMKVRGEY